MDGKSNSREGRRSAFTLVELAVSLVVLALLAALLLPAIGAVRETARRSRCGEHLHQFGVAWANAAGTGGVFPTATVGPQPTYWPLLPYLDQAPLLEQLLTGTIRTPLPVLDVFLCPSDPWPVDNGYGDSNYYLNDGDRFRNHKPGEYSFNGFSSGPHRNTRLSDFADGLSQTAAMSERLVQDLGRDSPVPMETLQRETGRYLWWTPRRLSGPGEEQAAAQMCRSEATSPSPPFRGMNANAWRAQLGYDHILRPNERGCHNAPDPSHHSSLPDVSLIPPTSLHAGGVNLLMADGRVQFVSDVIDEGVWRAIGSRNGGEADSLRQ